MVVLMFWRGNFREWNYITVFISTKKALNKSKKMLWEAISMRVAG
jgi:hypothetical protein